MMVAKRPTITVVFETKTTRVTLLTREMNCSFSPVAVPKAESQQNLPQLRVLLSFLFFFLGCSLLLPLSIFRLFGGHLRDVRELPHVGNWYHFLRPSWRPTAAFGREQLYY